MIIFISLIHEMYFLLYETMYNKNVYCHYIRRCIMTIFIYHYVRRYIIITNIFVIRESVYRLIRDDV